jgi:hypothetical protein
VSIVRHGLAAVRSSYGWRYLAARIQKREKHMSEIHLIDRDVEVAAFQSRIIELSAELREARAYGSNVLETLGRAQANIDYQIRRRRELEAELTQWRKSCTGKNGSQAPCREIIPEYCTHKWVSSPDVDGTYCVYCGAGSSPDDFPNRA